MDLQLADLPTFARGAIEHAIIDAAWVPYRCSTVQRSYYRKQDNWSVRSHGTAGISICLKTDATAIQLSARVTKFARDYLNIDLAVDGVITATQRWADRPSSIEATFALPQDGRAHDIVLYLPLTSDCQIKSLQLIDAATCEPIAKPQKRLLQLGDSITMGMNASGPGQSYAALLADLLGVDAVNQGIGGHIYDPDSLDTAIPFEPDLITVAYGSNDWAKEVSPAQLAPRVHTYLDTLRQRWACPIVVISPIYRRRPAPAGQPSLDEYGAFIRQLAAEHTNVTTIDGMKIMPHLVEMFADDNTHPGAAGMALMAQGIYQSINRINSGHTA